jgi:hypothetical protein
MVSSSSSESDDSDEDVAPGMQAHLFEVANQLRATGSSRHGNIFTRVKVSPCLEMQAHVHVLTPV